MLTRRWLMILGLGTLAVALVAAGDTLSGPQENDRTALEARVYDLTDLVVPTRVKAGELVPMSMPDFLSGVRPEVEPQLSRIAGLVRLALPNDAWAEYGGPGAVETYPERRSLVIRQTEAGHRAVDELLRQIRETDGFQIELVVEFVPLKEDAGNRCSEQNLGPALTPGQFEELRQSADRHTVVVRTENGRTVNLPGEYRLTPVASADRSSVEIRLDNITPMEVTPGMMFWRSLSHRIPVGNAVTLVDTYPFAPGAVALVVTPRIISRTRS